MKRLLISIDRVRAYPDPLVRGVVGEGGKGELHAVRWKLYVHKRNGR